MKAVAEAIFQQTQQPVNLRFFWLWDISALMKPLAFLN
ncbi:hypothetical protein M527_14080 [Sphingobium indicum IP26]|nr:hypothetical protein M527_14080 [Sphingobium indicum IP26]